jgi:hypothetical protein
MSVVVPELFVERPPFRALLRTDGLIAIIDDRKPLGQMTIATVASSDIARRVVARLALALTRTT